MTMVGHEFDDYLPSADVLDRMRDVPLIAVVGPVNAGKTSIMERVQQEIVDLHLVRSEVSREPRPQEKDGVHYFFRPLEDMVQKARNGKFATVAPSITGTLYATAPEEYDNYGRPLMAVLSSAIPLFRRVFPAMQTVVVVPPSLEIWQQRMQMRDTPELRMQEAVESLTFARDDPDALFVINDDLNQAVREFICVINKKSTPRLEVRQRQGRHIAAQILHKLI